MKNKQTEKQRASKSPLFGYRKPITDECGTWCNCTVPDLISSRVTDRQAYCLRCQNYWYN